MKIKKLVYGIVISGFSSVACALAPLDDTALSEVEAQALMSLSYISPTDSKNLETLRTPGSNIGFYKLAMEAQIELNANIKKLQLGCGGINGAGKCDIDIDNLSLSGVGATREARANSSAVLTNPFYEFAIKNPDNLALREVVGLRISAEKAVGLMTAGTENSNTPNGINSISGFMRIQSDSSGYVYGKASTLARFLDARENAAYTVNGQSVVYNNAMTARIDGGVAEMTIKTVGGGMTMPAMNNVPFIRPGVTVNGNRVSMLPLQAVLKVPNIQAGWRSDQNSAGEVVMGNPVETPIDWQFQVPTQIKAPAGPLSAVISSCISGCTLATIAGLNVGDVLQNSFMRGTITGITADVTINQGLGYIHYLPISSAMYISLQKEALRWPGTYSGPNPERTNVDGSINASQPTTITDVAQKGWWMSLADPINLGSVDPTDRLDIAPLFPQIASQVSASLNQAPYPSLGIQALLAAVLGTGDINVTVNNTINLAGSPLSMTMQDLRLNGQDFAPNCWGNLKFC